MTICRVAMMAYMWGDVERGQSPRQLYSDNDLRDLIHYADDLMAEGHTHEPVDGFDLLGFREWCKKELFTNPPGMALSSRNERTQNKFGYCVDENSNDESLAGSPKNRRCMSLMAWEINRYLRNGRSVKASIPGVGEVEIVKARADMAGRIACKTSDDDRFRNIEFGSVKVEERTILLRRG